jgi:hypothetical protein
MINTFAVSLVVVLIGTPDSLEIRAKYASVARWSRI